MKPFKKIVMPICLLTALGVLAGCGSSTREVKFSYSKGYDTPTIGDKTNSESHGYSSLKVNRVDKDLREDFAYGVDGSMIAKIEELGGVYYNQEGKEQDVYQILKDSGVNFFRVRLWNSPSNKYGKTYGGGENTIDTDIAMAKRAKAAGLNVLLDFHYSDFWADPDNQQLPKAWQTLDKEEIPAALKQYTVESLQSFKDAGVTVDAIQVGNEINNGMCGKYGAIDWNDTSTSFDYIASLIKAGIEGMKSVFPDCYSVVHLANGGNKAEFETYFKALDDRKVEYDIIGASYYPNLSGDISELQNNLNNVSALSSKPVMIVETSWGFTDDSIEGVTDNQYYSKTYEDVGGYLTSEQAQATCIRDIVNVLANVPNNLGLGIFYWEPAWLPVDGACWATKYGQSYKYTGLDSSSSDYSDGLATWSNQGLFSYTGKMLSSLNTFKYLSEGHNESEEKVTKVRSTSIQLTLNLAANETLPETYSVETDFAAIRKVDVVWDAASIEACKSLGDHIATGVVNGTTVTAYVNCIQNYVADPSFENQGETDPVKDPWRVDYTTPSGDKVVKLDRKTDTRTGKTDLNWYHSSKDFTFKVSQEITIEEEGTYHLATWIMAVAQKDFQSKILYVYINANGETYKADMTEVIEGWNAGYKSTDEVLGEDNKPILSGIHIGAGDVIEIGIAGECSAGAWGHNDDWSLVKE